MRLAQSEHSMALEAIYETENSIYLVLELLEGGEIFKMRDGALKTEDAKHITFQLLLAIKDLRKRNLIHRDLKPSNIMFKYSNMSIQDNKIALADFGLSALAKNSTQLLFRRCGTPGFIAPEVVNFDKETDTADKCHNCDIFSAGVIFHFMLTGKLPFEGETFQEILEKNEKSVIDWDTPELEKLSAQAISLLKGMLETDPERRFTPQQALDHSYFNKQQINRLISSETQNTINSYNSEIKDSSINPIEQTKVQEIDDLFLKSDSCIPNEKDCEDLTIKVNNLEVNKSQFKLSPFLEARQLQRQNNQLVEETEDSIPTQKLVHNRMNLTKLSNKSNIDQQAVF
jgi:calcium-dependent protein kinase